MTRYNKIRVNTRIEDWRYIPSEINIVDILSSVISFNKFHLLSTWFTGPEILVSNNHNCNFKGLKDKTACDKYVSKLLMTTMATSKLAYSMLTQKALVPHQYFGNIIRYGPKSNDISHA